MFNQLKKVKSTSTDHVYAHVTVNKTSTPASDVIISLELDMKSILCSINNNRFIQIKNISYYEYVLI